MKSPIIILLRVFYLYFNSYFYLYKIFTAALKIVHTTQLSLTNEKARTKFIVKDTQIQKKHKGNQIVFQNELNECVLLLRELEKELLYVMGKIIIAWNGLYQSETPQKSHSYKSREYTVGQYIEGRSTRVNLLYIPPQPIIE